MNDKQLRILRMPAGDMMDAFIAKEFLGVDIEFFGDFPNLYPFNKSLGYRIPYYSTDNSRALSLLDSFPYVKLEFDSATWQCVISPDLVNEFSASSDLENHSMALAVCRAILIYVFRDK